MTQEEKQLLIKDLCGRLPYGIKVCVGGCICTLLDINTEMGDKLNGETFHTAGFSKSNGDYDFCAISEVKPYLRPMSSMTDEEKKTFTKLKQMSVTVIIPNHATVFRPDYIVDLDDEGDGLNNLYDWLNANHFDYRGLIPMGLALEAPEGMYKSE